MRNFIDLIASLNEEDEKKTTVKDKTDAVIDFDLDDGSSKGELTKPVQDAPPPAPAGDRPGRVERGRGIRSGATDPQSMNYLRDLLNNVDLNDEISDEEAARRAGIDNAGANDLGHEEPVPPTPENLPAVINQALARTDYDGVPPRWEPKWTMVRDTPGYMQNQIRALGRMVFAPFTDTPIEDVNVMAYPFTNTENDVNLMAHWIRRNGVRDDEAEMQFEQIMPGYAAQTQIWNSEGYTFMLVMDHAGRYIYSWPGGRGVHVGGAPEPKRLAEEDEEMVDEAAFDDGFDAAKNGGQRDHPSYEGDAAADYRDGYDISKTLDDDGQLSRYRQFNEGAEIFDRDGQLYVRVTRNGHIVDTHGPFSDDAEAEAVRASLAGDPDILAGPFQDPSDIGDLSEEALQEAKQAAALAGIMTEAPKPTLATDKPLTEAEQTARDFAILAGVIPTEKRPRGDSEADKVADEIAALAGIIR